MHLKDAHQLEAASSLTSRRRSAKDGHDSLRDLPTEFYYKLEAFKNVYKLNFTLESSLISPYLIVQKGNYSWIDSPFRSTNMHRDEARSCYYTGIVNADKTSVATANLCASKGLVCIPTIHVNAA